MASPFGEDGLSDMGPLDLIRLTPLMSRSKGRFDLKVALIDGPVARGHPDLDQSRIQIIPADVHGSCSRLESVAQKHGARPVAVAKRKGTCIGRGSSAS